MGLCIQV